MDKTDVLQAFLQAWVDRDYKQMYQLSQVRWKRGKNPASIEALFSGVEIEGFNVFSQTYISSSCYRFNVDINLSNGDKIMVLANVICEDAEGKPIPIGVWGVNPVSAQGVVSRIAAPKQEAEPKPQAKKAPVKKTPKSNAKE